LHNRKEFPLKIVGDDLIIGGINVYAVNPKTGSIRWRQSTGVPYVEDIVIHNRLGYFTHSNGGDEMPTRSYLQAVDLTDGHVIWDRFYLGNRPWDYIYASDYALITVGNGLVTAIRYDDE
jgi:outer membrane protein assembly factor BamB